MNKRFFLLLSCFFSTICLAQTFPKTVRKEISFPITYVYHIKDTAVVFFDNIKGLNIKGGIHAKGYKPAATAVPGAREKKDFRQVASGRTVIYDTLLVCFFKLFNMDDTLGQGDIITLDVEIPMLAHRSIFSDLAFKGIIFGDSDKKNLYSLSNLIFNDSPQLEDSIFSVLLLDLGKTYELIKDRLDLEKNLYDKTVTGRYSGKSTIELLHAATRDDVRSFLIYAKSKSDGYAGQRYRFSESFAGWTSTGSPYSYPEIKQALFPVYKNKIQLEKLLPQYARDIKLENISQSISQEAISISLKKKFSEAYDLIDFAQTLAYAVNDTSGKAIVHIAKAQVLQNQEKYAEAITECEKSIPYALLQNNKDIEMQGYSKKAFCQYKSFKFSEAKTSIQQMQEKLTAYRAAIGESNYNKFLQKSFEYTGAIEYAAGNYDQALKKYEEAIAINKIINTYDALESNAGFYSFIGKVHNDQKNPKDALIFFEKAAQVYRNNRDTLHWAIVENDMAYSNYLLGNYQAVIDSCKSIFKKLLPIDPNNAGYTKSLMGSCYWELGHYDSAVIMNKESIALREKAHNVDGQAHSWLQTGELYQLSGLKKQALEAYASAEKLYKDLNDVSGLAGVYNERGKVYLQDENYKKATEYFEKARGISSKTTVEALYNLGTAWSVIDVVKAKEYYLACKLKSDSAGNTGYQFDATKMLSELAYRTHNIAGGNSYYEECLNIAQQLNIPVVYARCLSLKANGFYAQTKLDSALFYYNAALQIFDSVSKDEAITQINNIANVQLEMGDFSSSEKMLLKAIHQSTKSFNNIALGSTLQSITFLYGLTGEFAKGITSSDSAISIFERSGNRLRLGHVYVSRGTLLKSMGNYRQSINMFLSADTIYQEELASENRHIAMNNIGVTYYNQDDYKTAMKYFRLADSLLNSNEITQEYLLYKANIAECEFYLKNYDTAEAMFLKLYPLAREKKLNRIASGMALGLGKLFFEKKNLTKALNYFENAKNIAEVSGEKQKIIESLTFIGRIANEEKKTDLAELNFKKATALAGKSGISGGWEPYYELGLLYYNGQKFDSSIYYLRQAVDLLDKTSENLFGGEDARKIFNNDPRKSDLYIKITFAYFNMGNIKEAWSFANRSNVAGLKELSGALPATSSDAEKNEILKKIATLQQTKKTLEASAEKQTGEAQKQILKRIEILEADYTNFLQDAAEKYPDLKPYFDKTNAEEFYNYKGKLPNDVGVILYLVNDKTLMIFTLTNEKLSIDTMTADINAEVNAFIRTAKHPEKSSGTGPLITRSETLDEDNPLENVTFKDVSGKLYTTLIEPIRDKIKTKKRLCIIPTGLFSNMPFHCLGEKMSDSSFRFLIEDYEVFYANEMSVFDPPEATDKNKNDLFSFAAFGVPDNKLRFNISEVNAIGKIIGVKDSAIYINNRATERMAKQSLENKRYIHFATHGVLVYSSSFSQSYLKFLPDADSADGNNGQLTIKEIQSLLIQDCDLVILSACETAISQQLVKGWNISPANAFLKRKVKSVIASLWKVDDEATSILMNDFYKNLNKKMDKIDALRQAQKTLSRNPKYAHPFYWGAFVLYGDWR